MHEPSDEVLPRAPSPIRTGPAAAAGPGQDDRALRAARLDASSGTAVNALIHLYRAEVGRLTAYRSRLDTTTSWAITTSALITTFTIGNAQNPPAAFLFLMLCDYFFLHLEARRFVAYEASRYRVHLLERSFYGEVLGVEADTRWVEHLMQALRNPSPTISRFGALGWRLRRNYLAIFAVVLLAWIGKLHTSGAPTWQLSELLARAGVGDIPDWLVAGGVAVFYLYLTVIAVTAHRIYPAGDEESRHMEESLAVQ